MIHSTEYHRVATKKNCRLSSAGFMESRGSCLFGGLWARGLVSLMGHRLDPEAALYFHVVDGLCVEVIGELETTSIWLLDGRPSMVEETHTSMMLPGWKRKTRSAIFQTLLCMLLHTTVLTRDWCVGSDCWVFTQVQHKALGFGGHLAPHSEAFSWLGTQFAGTRPWAVTEAMRLSLDLLLPEVRVSLFSHAATTCPKLATYIKWGLFIYFWRHKIHDWASWGQAWPSPKFLYIV